jgi:hypothetical protein
MHKRIGLMAGGAAVTLAAITACTSSAAGPAAGTGTGGGTLRLAPVAEIQAVLSKASSDKTVHIAGTIASSGFTGTMDGRGQFGDNARMSVNMTMAGTTISEIWVGETLYLKMPALAEELGGKPWAKLDLSSMGPLGSTFKSLIDSAKNTDPAEQLRPLLASGDVHKVGTETVDGVRATHYSGTVDPATAFDSTQAAKNLTPAQIAQLKSLLKSGGVRNETIDVWVASDGLPVRETISVDTSSGAARTDLHLSDWGKPVTVTAPPADQVGDLSSMMSGLGGTSS